MATGVSLRPKWRAACEGRTWSVGWKLSGQVMATGVSLRPKWRAACEVRSWSVGWKLSGPAMATGVSLRPKRGLPVKAVLGPPGCAQVFPYLSPGPLDFLVV